MSDKDRKSLKEVMKRVPPPSVSSTEWERTWQGIAASRTKAAAPRWSRWLAYAAVFVAGLGIGVAVGTREPAATQATTPQGATVGPAERTLTNDPAIDTKSEDLEVCGLRNVDITPVFDDKGKTTEYRMTALTSRGVKVVCTYPTLDSIR